MDSLSVIAAWCSIIGIIVSLIGIIVSIKALSIVINIYHNTLITQSNKVSTDHSKKNIGIANRIDKKIVYK